MINDSFKFKLKINGTNLEMECPRCNKLHHFEPAKEYGSSSGEETQCQCGVKFELSTRLSFFMNLTISYN